MAFTTKLLGWLRGELHHFLGRYKRRWHAQMSQSCFSSVFQPARQKGPILVRAMTMKVWSLCDLPSGRLDSQSMGIQCLRSASFLLDLTDGVACASATPVG